MKNQNIEPNGIVFAGPFVGEFGWELSHWMPHVRWLRNHYKGRKLIVASYPGRHPLYYNGIADEFWNLPNWFTKEKYDCDCFESMCGQDVYAKLIEHFKNRLESKYDSKNILWTKTPRGFNKILRQMGHVTFDKLKASDSAVKYKDGLIKGHGNKPVVILFAREMHREKFLDVVHNQIRYCEDLNTPLPSNNWPRSHWEDLFEMLYKRFNKQVTFAIGGTKGGNCLLDVAINKSPEVIDLTKIDIAQSLDITMAVLNSALCSISSQSGPSLLSVQCGCPSFIYGHEEQRLMVDDNPLKTDVVYMKTGLGMYNDKPEVLYKDIAIYIKYLLDEKMGRETFDTGNGDLEVLDEAVKSGQMIRHESDIPFEKAKKDIVSECQHKTEYNINYYENMLREYSKSAEKISKARWDFISVINHNRVLDFGSGVGWFRAWRPKDVEVFSYDIGKFAQTGMPSGDFDVICMWDVIEHFEDLNQIKSLLDRTKHVALTVPLLPENQDLKTWKHYKPGEHYHHFTKETLDSFMAGYGFKHIKSNYNECPPRQDILSAIYKKDYIAFDGGGVVSDGNAKILKENETILKQKDIVGECKYEDGALAYSVNDFTTGGFGHDPACLCEECREFKDIPKTTKIKRIGIIGVFDVEGGTNIPFGKAFVNAGKNVEAFNYRTVASKIGWEATNKEIVKFSAVYDLIIFCKANGVTSDTIKACGRNALTCWYMMDAKIHLDHDPNYYKMANAADFSVVTTKEVHDALANGKYRIPNVHHILQGVDPKEFYPVDGIEKKYDVVFIGQKSPKRDSYLEAIIAAGFSTKAYGQGYNKPVYGKDFNRACAEGRILLAINNTDPDQDSFSDRIMRYMATKGCVLTEYSKGLEDYFSQNDEIAWFKNEEQLIEEIKMLLQDNALRNELAETGHKIVRYNYTWDKVAEQIIKIATGEERQ